MSPLVIEFLRVAVRSRVCNRIRYSNATRLGEACQLRRHKRGKSKEEFALTMAAQTFTLKLTRYQNQPWGFRMQGGKDFSTGLSVQKVQAESLADQIGLRTGDAILKINDINTDTLRHKEAQDVIMRAGNNLELTVQRGSMKTWKPTVTPLNKLRTLPKQDFSGDPPPVIKTSLAANKQDFLPIGSTHNVKAKPFNTYDINGSDRVTALVHKQYNSPAALYSMQNIADTLSAQAEVLTGGVKGDLQRTLDGEGTATSGLTTRYQAPSTPRSPVIRPVEAPVTYPSSGGEGGSGKVNENLCYECGRLIVGVFVRIKDKNLHAECFKCNTCGSNLKNVGYYNINDKLYCDVHAKQVARQNPPSGNLSPITVAPGAPLPRDVAYVPTGSYGSSGGYQGVPKPTSYSPTPRPMTAPSANVHKQYAGGSKFVWPPSKSGDEDTGLETAPTPSAPSPGYRAPPSTQHTHYVSAALKTSPTATPPLRSYSPVPKPLSPTPFTTAPPLFKSVTAPLTPTTPGSPWSSPTVVGTSYTGGAKPSYTSGSSNTGLTRPAPKRGKGILKPSVAPGTRIPICAVCGTPIRGPFVTALGKTWCPDHFHCVNSSCRRPLQDIGFVEEQGQLYCELCYETYLAPLCSKCNGRVKGDCLNAIGKHFHPECFVCTHCRTPFGNSHFYLEDCQPYCERDWNDMFTTKCVQCGFPIDAGDRWVEALNNNYHSHCFKCSVCNKNLEGQSFFAKGGRPFCKAHSR